MNTALMLTLLFAGDGDEGVVDVGLGVIEAIQLYRPGAVAAQCYSPGAATAQLYTAGADSIQGVQ
jgi:hypothetical protein